MACCMVLVTCPDEAGAGALAKRLVNARLAACVQIQPVTSVYTWDNQTQIDAEFRLIIKTKSAVYPELEQFIVSHHGYEVPQIVQVPIEAGLDAYLNWIEESTK